MKGILAAVVLVLAVSCQAFAQANANRSTASLPAGWRFVPDKWNFGHASYGPHRDRTGRSIEAVQFGFDEAARRKQYAEMSAAGRNFEQEAKAGRIYDGSHVIFTGSEFKDGVIEADICGVGPGDFQGIIFRVSPAALTSRNFDGEIVYFRPYYANNDKPHYPAIQYFASQVEGEERKLFASLEKDLPIPKDAWFHVRIEVRGKEAKVFLGDIREPALVVQNLASGRNSGLVGFWAWNGRLANLKLTPAKRPGHRA